MASKSSTNDYSPWIFGPIYNLQQWFNELAENASFTCRILPNGYLLEVGGTVEESAKGQNSVNAGMPFFSGCGDDFADDSIERSMSRIYCFLTAPLGLIGVVAFFVVQ